MRLEGAGRCPRSSEPCVGAFHVEAHHSICCALPPEGAGAGAILEVLASAVGAFFLISSLQSCNLPRSGQDVRSEPKGEKTLGGVWPLHVFMHGSGGCRRLFAMICKLLFTCVCMVELAMRQCLVRMRLQHHINMKIPEWGVSLLK